MKRHSTDVVSLLFGILFLSFASWWLIDRYVDIRIPHLGWITASVLIVVGLLGVAGSLRKDRNEPVSPSAVPVGAPMSYAAASSYSAPTSSGPTSSGPTSSGPTSSGPTSSGPVFRDEPTTETPPFAEEPKDKPTD